MNPTLSRLLSDYGMLLVLLVLCAFFSVVTYTEQSPTGEAAAKQLAAELRQSPGKGGRVLIAVRAQADDALFARKLSDELTAAGVQVAAIASGEPKDAREALQKLAAAGGRLDAIACNQATAAWLVFSDLKTDFPALGEPRVVKPRTHRWPNFLKSENLLNIANQIAVIAIGVTMVIIAGGIDLSVGSLIALSAVLAARFIRDHAGGLQAGPGGMFAACLAAILLCGLVGAFSGGMIPLCAIPPCSSTPCAIAAGDAGRRVSEAAT
jgi:ribose transport system permease protein